MAWGSVALAIVVTIVVVWYSSGPCFYSDEIGILGPAHLIAHPSSNWVFFGDAYMPGTSVFLAPLWWLSDDPGWVYRASVIVLALVSVAIIYPVSRLGRALGLTTNAAIITGSIVAIAPGHAVFANWVWSEQAFSLAVVFAVWRGLELARTVSARNALLFGLAAGSTFAFHGRALVFAAVAGIALLTLARRSLKAAFWGVAGYVITAGGGYALFLWSTSRLYSHDQRADRVLDKLVDQGIVQTMESLTAQAWYQTVGWAGLALLGAGLLVSLARGGTDRVFGRWALAAFGASFIFVILLMAGAEPAHLRLDLHIYGRYFDGFGAALAVLGLIAIIRGLSLRFAFAAGGITVLVSIGFIFLVVPRLPPGGWWEPGHIPGISHLMSQRLVETGTEEPWAAIVFVLALVVLAVLALARRAPVAVWAVALYFAFVTTTVDLGIIKQREEFARSEPAPITVYEEVPKDVVLAIDIANSESAVNWKAYTFWAFPRDVIFYDSSIDPRPSDFVLSWDDWSEAAQQGAWPIVSSWRDGAVVWVFPGELQDELVAQGLVVRLPDTQDG
jgi:hypothetical protein